MSRPRPRSGVKQLLELLRKNKVDELESLLQADESVANDTCTDAQLDKLASIAARREQQAWPLLHFACYHATAATVQLLLQHGAAAASKASPCSWTPAMVACCRPDAEAALATLLVLDEHGGCKKLGKAHDTISCMSLALNSGGISGSSSVNSSSVTSVSSSSSTGKNKKRNKPSGISTSTSSQPAIEIASGTSSSPGAGSSSNATSKPAADSSSNASSNSAGTSEARLQLLHWLVQHGAMPATMPIPAAQEVGQRMLLAGVAQELVPLLRKADPAFAQGSTGFAGLFRGVVFSQEVPEGEVEAAVKRLMQPPFQVNAPLHAKDIVPGEAAVRGYPCVMQRLIEAGLDPDARMDNMSSLLFIAVYNLVRQWNPAHTPAIVRMLLDAGWDPNYRSGGGTLPLSIALHDKQLAPLLWPPVTRETAEFWFEGAPVTQLLELMDTSPVQQLALIAGALSSTATADSAKATLLFSLRKDLTVPALMQLLPLLAVPTPKRRITHSLIWCFHLGICVSLAGKLQLGVELSEFEFAYRGMYHEAAMAGRAALKVSMADVTTFIKFFMAHPDIPALHHAIKQMHQLRAAVCAVDGLVALMPAGLRAALREKDDYLSCDQRGAEIFDACVRVVSSVCIARRTDVQVQTALFQPFVDAKHHIDLAAVFAETDKGVDAVQPLGALMYFQVVQVEVVEYWQEHPQGFQSVADVLNTMCDMCEGKREIETDWLVMNGSQIVVNMLVRALYGIVIRNVYAPECRTMEGDAWSPAWDARLTAARKRLLQSPVLWAVERLGNISLSLPDMKDVDVVVHELDHVWESIRLCRQISANAFGRPPRQPSPEPQRPAVRKNASRINQLNHGVRKCAQCGAIRQKDGKPLLMCPTCKAAYYCGRECQVANWKPVHKHQCKKKTAAGA